LVIFKFRAIVSFLASLSIKAKARVSVRFSFRDRVRKKDSSRDCYRLRVRLGARVVSKYRATVRVRFKSCLWFWRGFSLG
jgi:hypothetical protein